MDWVAIKLAKVARAVVETSLAIKPGEQVAIAADDDSDFAVVQALTAAVRAVGAEPTVLIMPRRELAGGPATRVMAKALLGADVIIAPTSTGLGFTDEFGEALKNGARGIVMTATDRDLLTAGSGLADYNKVFKVTKLSSASTIIVTLKNSTNDCSKPAYFCPRATCGMPSSTATPSVTTAAQLTLLKARPSRTTSTYISKGEAP